MIGASSLNVSAPVADQILSFLGVLEAAKDPSAVKAFLAQLAEAREQIRAAELSAYSERQAVIATRADAQALLDSVPEAERRKAQIDQECEAARQLLSDARADLERREQELASSRADWIESVNATGIAHRQEKAALKASWDELNAARLALSGEQAQLDVATAEVESQRATLQGKLAKLRAATADDDGEQA